ncbi:glycoside hydrolase family 2 TIM barrel-domain containing protein [Desertivirga arenae]|uniref:glycoside hydrolase family 2 TIM barrel-domain containing protein n=1 Tax=Desertivirga arenae TaxID=2810309 RepID=UPI001A969832|nr:glycoside hydrolase family 2 TIM barrel-domain containing protein [Pedobacter sp. SYSU D00823]
MTTINLKIYLTALFYLFLFFFFGRALGQIPLKIREDKLLNFDWKFRIGDEHSAKHPGYNDRNWQIVNLPHDGSIAGGFDTVSGSRQNGYRPRHIGWYRKKFTLPADLEGKKVSIEFEGVYRASEVWINGTLLGKHLNGYTSFSYDLTPYIKPGQENTLAVRYDNTYKLSSRWYTGEGIYRNVWLRIYHPLHFAVNGIFISTPLVTDKEAELAIHTEVENKTTGSALATVNTEIYSPSGKVVKSITATVPLAAGETYVLKQETKIKDPERWDIISPKIYKTRSSIVINSDTADVQINRFGIRTVQFTPEEGFLLNGRKVFLKGVNIHHDLGPLGAAAFPKGYKRRLLGLKAMGCNSVRLAHNPQDKSVLDLCDELGILVFDESFDKWKAEYYGADNDFEKNWQSDLAWFVKRDRNHPSVFIWSVGNEVFVKNEYKDLRFVDLLKTMMDSVRKIDPTRRITSGLYPARDEDKPAPMAFYTDVMSDNYMTRFYKRDRIKFPQLIFLASEMTTDNGGENFFNYDHSYACGQYYWGGTDYIGESFAWPSKGWNGIVDWCDFWKPISYYIQSLYSESPMVKIAVFDAKHTDARVWNDVFMNTLKMSGSWNWQPGQKLTLYTFTTGDEVELFVNGTSLGVKKLKDFAKNKIIWELDFQPGSIKAIARKDGKDIAVDEIKTAGEANRIVLKTDSTKILSNGLDLAYIEVNVLDKNGVLVPDAANNIQFKVEGPADIAGVANGNRMSDEFFVAKMRKVHEGKCLLVLRSKNKSGKINIQATSPGLKAANLEIKAIPE